MTETHSNQPEPTTESLAVEERPLERAAAEPLSRRNTPDRPHRVYRIAAAVVAAAAAVFIVGAIFWSGFMLGAFAGGQHHGHGGGSTHGYAMMHHPGAQMGQLHQGGDRGGQGHGGQGQ